MSKPNHTLRVALNALAVYAAFCCAARAHPEMDSQGRDLTSLPVQTQFEVQGLVGLGPEITGSVSTAIDCKVEPSAACAPTFERKMPKGYHRGED